MFRASAVRSPARLLSPSPSPSPQLLAPHFSLICSATPPARFSAMPSDARIAVVGDVHDEWDLVEDSKALQLLQPDLVLFTGDYGNENVELVRSLANLRFPKAAILGNHDCWNTHHFSKKKSDRVQLQLESLGGLHVGYNHLAFPSLNLSVVGSRPFSCGGDRLFRPSLLSKRYGVSSMEDSAIKIQEAALSAPHEHFIVLLAHNGPSGLGSRRNDICGRDWVFEGGDHGDPDLARAIKELKSSTNLRIPLVIFGHMHKELAYRSGSRKMVAVGQDGIVYLNAAIVPRVKHGISREFNSPGNVLRSPQESRGTLRAFTMVEIVEGNVKKAYATWVLVVGERVVVEEEHLLLEIP